MLAEGDRDFFLVGVDCHDVAVFLSDGDRPVLVADLLARLDNGFQQIADAEPARDARQIGTHRRAVVVEPMTGRAARRAEQLATAFEIAPAFQPALNGRHKFIDLPFLDELSGGDHLQRRFPFRPGFQDRRERALFLGAKRGDCVILHVAQETGETGAALEVRGFEEPAEILFTQRRSPGRLEHPQRARIIELFLLCRSSA